MSDPQADLHRQWIDTVSREGVNLTPWEEDFITSIDQQLERRGYLSEPQAEILERIYSERTS